MRCISVVFVCVRVGTEVLHMSGSRMVYVHLPSVPFPHESFGFTTHCCQDCTEQSTNCIIDAAEKRLPRVRTLCQHEQIIVRITCVRADVCEKRLLTMRRHVRVHKSMPITYAGREHTHTTMHIHIHI